MVWVNDKNYIRYSSDTETVNMLESAEDGNDHINLKKMKEATTVVGGTGKDTIYGSTKHMNYLFGDNIWGFDYSDQPSDYSSYSGKDNIYGGNNTDIIHGGLGNDKIHGQGGINIFQFKKGDGKDTVYMGRGKDYLYFCDTKLSDLTYVQQNKDLIVKYGTNDQVTIKDYFKTFGYVSLKGIADSTFDVKTMVNDITNILAKYDPDSEWQVSRAENKVEDYLEKLLRNLPSPKSIYEKTGLTIIRTKGGESKGTDANDIITGSKKKDKLYGNGGNDLISGGKGNDRIDAGKGNDIVDGGKGNDTIYGYSGKNTITGGKGNDKIYSGTGADTFVYAKGAGKDTIYNANSGDKIQYKDVASMSELKFAKKRNDIVITRKNGSKKETITLSDYFRTSKKLDKILLSNGTTGSILQSAQLSISGSGTIDGSEFNETIKGSFRADVIYGRAGNDKITGHKGKDTINAGTGTNGIYFGKNDGDDVVLSGGGEDTLIFKKQYRNDLRARYSGNNVIIYYKGGTVTLKGYKKGGHSAKYIKTKSGTILVDDLLPAQKIKTEDVVTVNGTELKDRIVVSDYATTTVNGKGGSDYIEVNTGDVTINAGKGDDTIKLNNGGNTLRFYSGDGKDTVNEVVDILEESNTFVFENETNAANLKFTKNTNGYTIGYNNNADSVTVIQNGTPEEPDEDFFGLGNLDDTDTVKIKGGESFVVSNKGLLKVHTGNDGNGTANSDYFDYSTATTIRAYEGDDYIVLSDKTTRLDPGKGNDQIVTDDTADRSIYFYFGDGNDVVYDQAAGGRSKDLQYVINDAGNFDNVSVTRIGNTADIKISYNGGKDSIIIKAADDSASTNPGENEYGYLNILGDRRAISSWFESDDPDLGKSLASVNQLRAEVASFTSSKASDVPAQVIEDNKQNLTELVSAYVNTDNAFAALA